MRNALTLGMSLLCLTACKKDAPPPPPQAAAKVEPLSAPPPAATGVSCKDAKAPADAEAALLFPVAVAGYCLDPKVEPKTFGKDGKYSMDEVCTNAFDGECEVYKSFGLERVVQVAYANEKNAAALDIIVSRYKTTEGAFGFYSKRTLAEGDPTESKMRGLEAGVFGAAGTGKAYTVGNRYVVELTYNSEDESPEQIAASSAPVLAALAKAIGAKFPEPLAPKNVLALPKENRLPAGFGFTLKGPTLRQEYADASSRWLMGSTGVAAPVKMASAFAKAGNK